LGKSRAMINYSKLSLEQDGPASQRSARISRLKIYEDVHFVDGITGPNRPRSMRVGESWPVRTR
jgi:hypothetical protein